jgi:nucleotide-binding universal stress UspA family protein
LLLRVAETIPFAPGVSLADLKRVRKITVDGAHEPLECVTAQAGDQGVQVKSVAIEGRPNVVITQLAEPKQIDLIVLRARGRSGFSRWLMAGVADRVVRGANVSVLLVRAAKKTDAEG